MTYDCMTPDELAGWRESAAIAAKHIGYVVQKPCSDCPLSFRLEEYRAGRCCLPEPATWAVAEERRAYNREWMRRKRATA